MSVSVKLWNAAQRPGEDVDAFVAISHAMHGRPVEVRITEGNDTRMLHLSLENARQLSEGLPWALGDAFDAMDEADKGRA